MTRKETTEFLSNLLIRDRFSGMGNYFVMPMSLYKSEITEIKYNYYIGVMVPIPKGSDKNAEFESPAELDPNIEWELAIIKPARPQNRKYSLAELLFCMLRSGNL